MQSAVLMAHIDGLKMSEHHNTALLKHESPASIEVTKGSHDTAVNENAAIQDVRSLANIFSLRRHAPAAFAAPYSSQSSTLRRA